MEPVSLQTATRHASSLGKATVNTLNALYDLHEDSARATPKSGLPTFIPSAMTLVASGVPPPDGESREFMRQFTSGAQATALSNFYDSIIAGPFSEESNGEFTDVGLWLGNGHYQIGQETAVLASLGLKEWKRQAGAKLSVRAFETPVECNVGLSAAYGKLRDTYCFCVSSGGVQTLCFLLGRMNDDDQWCGLASIAITSD